MKPHYDLVILCQLFYPELVSTGQTLTELCETLSDKGTRIKVICGPTTIQKKETTSTMTYKTITIKRVWGTRFSKVNTLGKACNLITYALSTFFYLLTHRSKTPLLVLTNPPFLGIFAALLKKFGGAPYAYLIFDVYPETAIQCGLISHTSLTAKLWKKANQFIYKHASHIIVIGRCMKAIIQPQLPPNYKAQLHNIPVWADTTAIGATKTPKTNNPYIKKWNLEGKFVLSYSGNMGRFHDLETFLKAAEALKDDPDIHFLFIGEGFKKKLVEKTIAEKQLTNCSAHTYVPKEDLGLSLSLADIGLVSLLEGQEGLSVPSKTFGLMAAGVPTIAVMSKQSEIARILTETDSGVVIKPGDHTALITTIKELKNNTTLRETMSQNAKNAIKTTYNLQTISNSYQDLIGKLNESIH